MWGTMMGYQLTLGSILERAGSLFGGTDIISRMPDRSLHRYTYSDFYRRSNALAESLQKAGLRRGERVATLMFNHYVHLEAFFGVPASGGVLHAVNHRLHPNDITYILSHAEDRFLIIDDVLLPLLREIQDRVACQQIIAVPLTHEGVPKQYENYEAFLARSEGNPAPPSLHENEAAVICYTSGTAGSPKGVVYSHRALVLHSLAMSLPDCACISEHDTVMPIVPMHHTSAWGLPVAATMAGCRQVFAGMYTDAGSLLDLMRQEKVTLSAGVPAVWLGILHQLEGEGQPWKAVPEVRAIVSGAAPPPEMLRRLDEHGIHVSQAWGLVEGGPLATFATVTPSLVQSGEKEYAIRCTQGRPMPFVELRATADSEVVPKDGSTLGEAQLRGPWVASSYYNLPELRGKWTDDGWFRTGDVVTIDPQGYMKLTDRARDLIRSDDDWISSVDLENALMGHAAVKEAAVIAVAHPKLQERPLAAVVLKDGVEVSAEQLRSFLSQRFAPWQIPDAFVFLIQLPHTPTGKLLKKELRNQFRDWKWQDSEAAEDAHRQAS